MAGASESSLVSNFGLAMIAALWSYEGWQFASFSAGEAAHPQRDFPRAFFYGTLSLTCDLRPRYTFLRGSVGAGSCGPLRHNCRDRDGRNSRAHGGEVRRIHDHDFHVQLGKQYSADESPRLLRPGKRWLIFPQNGGSASAFSYTGFCNYHFRSLGGDPGVLRKL